MNEQRQFFHLLKEMKRKLWLHEGIRILYMSFLASAGVTLFWLILSRFFLILNVDTKVLVSVGVVILASLMYFVMKKPSDTEAASRFDDQGLESRVQTAYHYLEDDSDMAKLQRKDTLNKMKEVLPKIKQERIGWFDWKKLSIAIGLFALAYLSLLFPSSVMEQAEQIEKEEKIVQEQKEKVKELAEEQKENSEEAKKELEKLVEEVKKEQKAEEIQEDLLRTENQLDKLKKQAEQSKQKLEDMSERMKGLNLDSLAQALNNVNQAQMENRMADLKKQMEEMDQEQLEQLQKQLQEAAKQMGLDGENVNQPSLSNEELEKLMAQMEDELKKMMKKAGNASKLAQTQADLQKLAQQMNQQMMSAGLGTSGSLSFAGSSSSSGSFGGQGQSGQSGQSGSGSGSESGANGSGSNGSGSGSGAGSGSGSGSGSGTGNGSGNGVGNGAGLGAGNQNLTVPQEGLEGKDNVERDTGELGEGPSEQQIAPNAPILPGQVRSYEEVYQKYEDTYRQALERNDYPDRLQRIIKEYFSDIEPKEGDSGS